MEAIRFNHGWKPVRGWLIALSALAWLTGCGGNDDAPPAPPPPAQGSATVGAAGGFVDGPDGVRLALPPDATASGITFRIARDGGGAPPVPEGVDLVSAVYAITPHGQEFELPVALRVPSNPALAAGRPTFLMKASPGGRWAVIGTDTAAAASLQASIGSLSYFAVGACTNNLPPNSIGAQNCPTSNVLRFELLTDSGTPFPVSQDTTYGAIQPVLLVTTPTTVTGRFIWTRAPLSFARSDRLDTGSRATGTGSGVLIERQAGIAWSSDAPDDLDVTQDVARTFTITVTPAQVAGAAGPNGVVRPLWAQAVAGPWEYNALIPIRIRDVGATGPTITQQPADAGVVEGQTATFTVVTTGSGPTYQWQRRPAGGAAFAPIVGATAASYTTPAVTLADHGAQFQVQVCAGASPCTTSNTATLSVAQAPVVPAFTLQPANAAVVAGQTASFTATASGVPTPSIRWQSAAPSSTSFVDVATTGCPQTAPASTGSSTTATCTVGPFAIVDSGRRYRALALSSVAPAGVPSDAATLTVTPAPTAPSITTQPTAQSTTAGGSATFSVVATGTAPLGYTWQINGTPLPTAGGFTIGACLGTVAGTGASLTLTGLSAGCSGVAVTVVVSNGINPDATSNPATLTVNAVGSGLSLLAGAIGGFGSVDGTGTEARVMISLGGNAIAADAAGTAYFTESISNRVRKITAAGVVSTIDGGLRAPEGVAVDSAGNVYVAERGAHRILRYSPAGVRSVFIGGTPGDVDGDAAAARILNPRSMAIDASDNIYFVQDNGDFVKIRRVTSAGQVSTVHDFGGGSNGVGAIAVAPDGSEIFGAGFGPSWFGTLVRIAGGNVTVVAGAPGEVGYVDANGGLARFFGIGGLVRAVNGNLFVSDSNNRVIRRITPVGDVNTVSGANVFPSVPADGSGSAARYELPAAIGRLPNDDLLLADGPLLRRLANTTSTFDLSTVAGKLLATGTADGVGSAARFRRPGGVALDAGGNAFVADLDRIRLVTAAGGVSTLVSQPAQFIVRDGSGGFIVASSNALWRLSSAGVPTLLAGDPLTADYVDAPVGTDARFSGIRGIAVDGSGNVFVVAAGNTSLTVRRVTPTGEVTTWAGDKDAPSDIVDGDRLTARFGLLSGGIVVDAGGDLLVTDFAPLTGAALLRRITPAGVVSTFVGAGAGLVPAFHLALEASGSVLAGGDATLQRIGTGGSVTTLVGTQFVRGVKLGASPQLSTVNGLAVRPNGSVVLTSEAAVLELVLP